MESLRPASPCARAARLHLRRDETLERALLDVLRAHRGRASAVTSESLASLLGRPNRDIRLAVKLLIEEQGALIGSATSAPPGFYWIVSQEELEIVKAGLRARGLSCLTRMAKLDNTSVEILLGQLALELAPGAAATG